MCVQVFAAIILAMANLHPGGLRGHAICACQPQSPAAQPEVELAGAAGAAVTY